MGTVYSLCKIVIKQVGHLCAAQMLPALIEIEHRQLHVHRLSAGIEGTTTHGTVIVGYHSDTMGKHVVVAF